MPILEDTSKDHPLYRMRHSLSHVMAQAIQKLYPGTLLGFGPPIDDGFYYDFIFPESVTFSDKALPQVEKEMRKIIREKQSFEREDLPAPRRVSAHVDPHARCAPRLGRLRVPQGLGQPGPGHRVRLGRLQCRNRLQGRLGHQRSRGLGRQLVGRPRFSACPRVPTWRR